MDRDPHGPVEPVGHERLRRLRDEVLHLLLLELVEEIADRLGVGGDREGPGEPPCAVDPLDGERLVARLDLEARHALLVVREHRAVAEVRERARRVAKHALREGDDGGLLRLARVDPGARRALRPEGESELPAVLEP